MNNNLKLILLLLFLCVCNVTWAQVRVTGVVKDTTGEPVIGANITEKATPSNGTITDVDGNFVLAVSNNAVLIISYIGYKTQEIPVGNKIQFIVTLQDDTEVLEDVVVVGYGTMKKSDVIGSVASVGSDAISRMNVTRADQALQGQAAGVMVSSSSGTAGSTPVIKVRGINSINLGTDPLWVVDGVVVGQGFMNNVSPDDIQSMEILKDAAATAIYGSRASSGVVLVTTKSGQGKGEFRVSYRMGVSQLNYKDNFSNHDEYWSYYDTAKFNDSKGQIANFDPHRDVISGLFKNRNETLTREQAMTENNNWVEILTRTAVRHDLNLSTSQGGDNWKMYASFNYVDEKGVVKGNDLNRLSGSLKVQREIFKGMTVGASTNLSYNKSNNSYDFSFITRPIWYKPYSDDPELSPTGYWNALVTNPWQNPLLIADGKYNKNRSLNFNMLSKAWLEYAIPGVKGLSIKSEVAMNYASNRNLKWKSKEVDYLGEGSGTDSNSDAEKLHMNIYGSYDQSIGKHYFNVAAGYEYMEAKAYYTLLSGTALSTDYDFMGTPDKVLDKKSYIGGEDKFGSLFARTNYKWNDRYLAGLSFRRDATYQFAPGNRWSNFLAGSLGWIISNEDFYNIEWMNLLKIRGSFGQTGNSNVSGSVRYNTYNYNAKGYGTVGSMDAYLPKTLGNDKIKWEKTNTFDAGFDFGFLNNRINGSIAYFEQRISDLILNSPLPLSTGLGGSSQSMTMNVGKMKNYGVEFGISSTNIIQKDFKWTTNFNFTFNKNKVLSLSPTLDGTGTGIVNDYTITKVGEAIGTYYIPYYEGVDSEKGIRTIRKVEKLKNGETVLTNEVIPGTQNNKKGNRYIHSGKTGIPIWYGGLTNTLTYKGFDLNFLFTFAGGHYIYDNNLQAWMGDGKEQTGNLFYAKLATQSWEKAGDKAKFPQASYMNQYYYNDAGEATASAASFQGTSSEFMVKGDYLRLKNLSLGYTFPKRIVDKLRLGNLYIYAAASNLFTITSYKGLDVELQSNNNFTSGVRNNNVPTTRTFTFGINVGI